MSAPYDEPAAHSRPPDDDDTCCNCDCGSGVIDWRYIKTWRGWIIGVEAVCCLIAFICIVASGVCGSADAKGYFAFVTSAALVTTFYRYIILLFKFQRRCCCCKGCDGNTAWPKLEGTYFIVLLIMFFIGVILVSIGACNSTWKAAVVFGWFAFVAFCVDAVFVFQSMRLACKGTPPTSTSQTTSSRNVQTRQSVYTTSETHY